MSKNRTQKNQEVTTLVDRLGRMKSVVFSSYQGLTVPEATALRKELREAGVDYQAVKKTLLARALEDAGIDGISLDQVEGGMALAFGYEDEVLPAKLLDGFKKEHPQVTLQGGIVGRTQYAAAQMQALAKLPSRQQLMASILGSLRAPMANMVSVMAGPTRGLVQVLKAKSEQA